MDSKIYSQKRDELVNILQKVTAIEELSPQKKQEFEVIKKKCLEDQFNIVLVGEFQGGKSTTFNTFCDGREISPRGALVKTSACRLTARNLSDKGKEEFAEVFWKTERELLLNIEDILGRHIELKKDLGITFKPGDEIYGLSDALSFKNPAHETLINKALSEEWKAYENNRGNYNTENLDILRIATLIARYASSRETAAFRQKKLFSINDIPGLIVFPENWETRWKGGINADFNFKEVLFCLIAGIDCFIHSPNLSRLGCSITDCPGLFASKWDTQVALDAIPKSDAIIYLLRGDRAIGTEETRALREIQKMPAAHKKLFLAINMKVSRHIIDSSIIPSDVATIRNIGISVEPQDIKKYHALMAFLGEFGAAILNKKLEKSSEHMFATLAKRMLGIELPVEEAWVMLANQQLAACAVPPEAVAKLDGASVEKVKAFSGSKGLFSEVENFIIANKAFSILITNGAEKAGLALTDIESALLNREKEATDNVAKRETELESARLKLEAFQAEAKSIVNTSFEPAVYEILRADFIDDVLLGSSAEISVKVAFKLEKKLTADLGWRLIWKNKENRAKLMGEIAQPIYREVMHEVIGNRANVWLVAVAKGENNSYLKSVAVEANRIKAELEKKWQELLAINFNFSPVDFPDIFRLFDNLIGKAGDLKSDQLGIFYKVAINGLLTNILMYVLLSPMLAAGWLIEQVSRLFSETPPVTTPDETIPSTVADLNFTAKQLQSHIHPGLMATYGDQDASRELKANVLAYLQKIGDLFKKKCLAALDDQAEKFAKDHEQSKANLKTSLDERRKVAAAAKLLRETRITPCRKELNVFVESVNKTVK